MQVRRVRLQIETISSRVIGTLQLPTEGYRSRTTDFLNAHETGFIALTDVEVHPLGGGQPSSHPYAAIGSRHIVTLTEIEDLGIAEEEPLPPVPQTSAPPPPPS